MDPRQRHAGMTIDKLQSWRLVNTAPMSGVENMRLDAECLKGVEQGHLLATLRFFRFNEPTLSYGRLQKYDDIAPLIPHGWASIQRPTGGGVVFHNGDLCFSLCWEDGQTPLPKKPQDQYRWIHSVVLESLTAEFPARMASCCDVGTSQEPFAVRTCFQNPVGYDLLRDQKKILGGALRCTRRATLYQGSLQMGVSPALEECLAITFKDRLSIP